jgi:transcriptional regulator with XRE-family HTH domain
MKKRPVKISAENSLVAAQRHLEAVLNNVNWTQLADRLRLARLRQGVSIRELAARAEVSKTSIVRLESGKPCETDTVARVCHAMGLHADALVREFSADDRVALHKRPQDAWYDMVRFSDGPLQRKDGSPLTPSERRKKAEKSDVVPLNILASRLPGGKLLSTIIELYHASPTRSHPGEEWVYVLSGIADISIADKRYELGPGESVVFRSAEPHSYAPKPHLKSRELPVRLLSVRLDG